MARVTRAYLQWNSEMAVYHYNKQYLSLQSGLFRPALSSHIPTVYHGIYTSISYYNDNLMILIERLAAIGSGTRRFQKAQMQAEFFLQIVLVYIFWICLGCVVGAGIY